jgi:hypothetical protein
MSALSVCLAESSEVSVGAVGIEEPRAGASAYRIRRASASTLSISGRTATHDVPGRPCDAVESYAPSTRREGPAMSPMQGGSQVAVLSPGA